MVGLHCPESDALGPIALLCWEQGARLRAHLVFQRVYGLWGSLPTGRM